MGPRTRRPRPRAAPGSPRRPAATGACRGARSQPRPARAGIDEAIDYLVTEYARPITDEETLERAFWATAAYRVKRVHERRGETIRAGWRRVDIQEIDLPAPDADPVSIVVREVERGALVEFAATLTDVERRVLSCKYGGERYERGWRVIARMLEMPVSEVRSAERSVRHKLERFVATVSAGSLCAHRSPALEALAAGLADKQHELLARIHLDNCTACRVAYAEHMRALRAGDLQHRIAQLLPVPPTVVAERRRGGPWEAIVDWLSRPFSPEAMTTGTQLAAGARGLGAIATVKLAAMRIGGVIAVGGGTYCATTLLQRDPPEPAREQPPLTTPQPRTDDPRLPRAGESQTAARKAANRNDGAQRPRRSQRSTSAPTAEAAGGPATQHERDVAVSPPVQTGTAATGAEFEPAPASSAPATPAAPPSTGAPEFP